MSYDPYTVLQSIDDHTFAVMAFMSLCLVCTFVYLVSAFKISAKHQAYPAPLFAVGWFAIHDAHFVSLWHTWFVTYDHWWLKLWAIALIFTAAIEFALCYKVYKYGREEIMPKLSQNQWRLAVIGSLLVIAVTWLAIKSVLDDPLYLFAFALTALWPPVWSTMLLIKRQSLRGQSRLMNWCLLGNPIGMCGAWMILDPWFRSPYFVGVAACMIGWAAFNVWLVHKYPEYTPVEARFA